MLVPWGFYYQFDVVLTNGLPKMIYKFMWVFHESTLVCRRIQVVSKDPADMFQKK